jgi:hypothetical protein
MLDPRPTLDTLGHPGFERGGVETCHHLKTAVFGFCSVMVLASLASPWRGATIGIAPRLILPSPYQTQNSNF